MAWRMAVGQRRKMGREERETAPAASGLWQGRVPSRTVDLGNLTTTLDADADVDLSKLVLAEQVDGLLDLWAAQQEEGGGRC